MKSLLLAFLIVFTALAEAQDCACTRELWPVCGSDGTTYANPCIARCHRAEILYKGKCEDPLKDELVDPMKLCPCTFELWWVCGSDRVSYANSCLARCHGAKILYDGECEVTVTTLCPCTKELRPVCGSDGVTYDNPCLARCHRAEILYKGKCGDPLKDELVDPVKLCPCTFELWWVCGSDRVSYANSCLARCHGATILYDGKCGDPFPPCRCTKELRRVCGSDGITYANPCLARCGGAKILYHGKCGDPLNEFVQS